MERNEASQWVVHFSDQNTCSFNSSQVEKQSPWKYKQNFYIDKYFVAICTGNGENILVEHLGIQIQLYSELEISEF